MNTNDYLNAYRFSLLSDDLAFQILSLLHRDGAKKEIDISNIINQPLYIVLDRVQRLYQAGFIRVDQDHGIGLTKYGETLLTRLGITDIAVRSILESATVEGPDLDFINACAEYASSVEEAKSQQQLNLLKSWRLVVEGYNPGATPNKEDSARILLVIIIGLDEDVHRRGVQNHLDDLSAWLQNRHAADPVNQWLLAVKTRHLPLCKIAMRDAMKSDEFLFQLIEQNKWRKAQRIPMTITMIRLVNAAIYEDPDPGLVIAFERNKNLPQQIRIFFDAYKANLAKARPDNPTGFDLEAWDLLNHLSTEAFTERLRIVLEQQVSENSKSTYNIKAYLQANSKRPSEPSLPTPSKVHVHTLKEQISLLQEVIFSPEFDNLSIEVKRTTYEQLEALLEKLRKHTPPVTS